MDGMIFIYVHVVELSIKNTFWIHNVGSWMICMEQGAWSIKRLNAGFRKQVRSRLYWGSAVLNLQLFRYFRSPRSTDLSFSLFLVSWFLDLDSFILRFPVSPSHRLPYSIDPMTLWLNDPMTTFSWFLFLSSLFSPLQVRFLRPAEVVSGNMVFPETDIFFAV